MVNALGLTTSSKVSLLYIFLSIFRLGVHCCVIQRLINLKAPLVRFFLRLSLLFMGFMQTDGMVQDLCCNWLLSFSQTLEYPSVPQEGCKWLNQQKSHGAFIGIQAAALTGSGAVSKSWEESELRKCQLLKDLEASCHWCWKNNDSDSWKCYVVSERHQACVSNLLLKYLSFCWLASSSIWLWR